MGSLPIPGSVKISREAPLVPEIGKCLWVYFYFFIPKPFLKSHAAILGAMAPSRGKVEGKVDGVSYVYYPKQKSGMLTFPDGMLSGDSASIRFHNFRVTAEFGGDIEAAIRAKIILLKSRAEVEKAPQPASSTDAPSSASVVAERPQRRRAQVDSFDPSASWSSYARDQVGQRHYAVTPHGDFSKASREELNAMHARVVAYQAALQAFIDKHCSSADRSSAGDEDAMDVDLFAGAEPRATLRPTSATPTVGVGKPECIVALQNAMIDLLHEEDLALHQETEGEEDEDTAVIPAEPAAAAAAAALAATAIAAAETAAAETVAETVAAIATAETAADETAAADETVAAIATAETAFTAAEPADAAPPAAKRQRVLTAASARVRAGQELRALLTQVKQLERGGSSAQAADIVDEQFARPEPSDHLARKRADELQRNLFSIGDWQLTSAALEKFLEFPAVARLRQRDAPAPKRTDQVDADTATELLAAAKIFFTQIMHSSGRRTAEDMNAFWAGAAALLPPDLLQNRHGRAAMRILGVVRLARAARARGTRTRHARRDARARRARFSHAQTRAPRARPRDARPSCRAALPRDPARHHHPRRPRRPRQGLDPPRVPRAQGPPRPARAHRVVAHRGLDRGQREQAGLPHLPLRGRRQPERPRLRRALAPRRADDGQGAAPPLPPVGDVPHPLQRQDRP